MKFGIQVSCYLTSWDAIRSVVETMEVGRWHSVYHADHFVPPNRPSAMESETAFEGYSTMAAVAGITNRLKLGHLVLGNTYRNPGLTAKMAGTIRPHLPRQVHPVHRRRMVRARAQGVRLVLPIAEGTFRPPRRGRKPHQAAFHVRLPRQLQRTLLHPRKRRVVSWVGADSAHTDHDRWHGRTSHAENAGDVR